MIRFFVSRSNGSVHAHIRKGHHGVANGTNGSVHVCIREAEYRDVAELAVIDFFDALERSNLTVQDLTVLTDYVKRLK
jgi:hypothetical protein